MGCDIHMFVEVKNDGKWKAVPRRTRPEPEYSQWDKRTIECPYDDRNYDLFAMLANVRNGVGFAGIRTGEGFVPISMPKGFPDDASDEVLLEFAYTPDPEDEDRDHWEERQTEWLRRGYSVLLKNGMVSGPDWHSTSYLTVKELQEYDWDQVTEHQGWVTASGYEEFKSKGKPSSWCGGVEGTTVDHISNKEMEWRISDGRRLDRAYTLVEWSESYRASARSFLEQTLPYLESLGKPEDVRIVFWFDN